MRSKAALPHLEKQLKVMVRLIHRHVASVCGSVELCPLGRVCFLPQISPVLHGAYAVCMVTYAVCMVTYAVCMVTYAVCMVTYALTLTLPANPTC